MSAAETILAFLGTREEALLQLARDLVATPSPTPPGDERAVAQRIIAEFQSLNLGSPQILAASPERPNLCLRVRGSRPGPSLILNGHTDTKPPGNRAQWKTDPFDPVIRDGMLYGLGSTDMKGAVAAMIYATAALAEVRESVAGELQLILSADEEGGSAFGVKYLASAGYLQGDAALIGEASGVRRELEFIDLASRGICCFRFQVYGDQMHSSLSDEFQAVNASVKAGELLSRFAGEFKLEGATVNAGVTLSGGVSFGVVPVRLDQPPHARITLPPFESSSKSPADKRCPKGRRGSRGNDLPRSVKSVVDTGEPRPHVLTVHQGV